MANPPGIDRPGVGRSCVHCVPCANGFHLKFENASDLGNDSSGNNNDYTSSMGPDHQVLDSPTFGS